MTAHDALRIQIQRGKSVESEHLVDMVALRDDGTLIENFGDQERMTFPRSAIKLAQATLFAEKGLQLSKEMDDRYLALACSSHRGQSLHVELVDHWLKLMNLKKETLACGSHYPGDREAEMNMIRNGLLPDARHNNCSGKHCGFLSHCLETGMPVEGYEKYEHPLQQRLREVLSEFGNFSYSSASWGIDGCSIPTYLVPLRVLAQTMLAFVPQSKFFHGVLFQKIFEAVAQNPVYFNGSQTFSSSVIQLSKGQVVAKTGAEGVYSVIIPEAGVSVAIKARDGSTRASEAAVVHALRLFYSGFEKVESNLLNLHPQVVTNWSKQPVGRIVTAG